MKSTLFAITVLLFAVTPSMAQDKTAPKPKPASTAKLDTELKKLSYIIGHNIGSNIKRDNLELDYDILLQGMKEAAAGKASQISQAEASTMMMNLQKKMQEKQAAAQNKILAANIAAGKAYLEANGKKEGVVTTQSGLQYKIIKKGTGAIPKANQRVKVHYTGTRLDGTVFDSSVKRGQPFECGTSSGVIKGWLEVLKLMPVGSKWEVSVPAELGYGSSPRSPSPGGVLKFEIELLEIISAAEPMKLK